MSRLDEEISERFHRWEMRGRGWTVFPRPVSPEPPFVPFPGHDLASQQAIDDGRRPTFLSSLVRRLIPPPATEARLPVPEEEPEPDALVRDPLVELQTSLPADLDITREAFEQFLRNLSMCREPIGFELLGVPKRVAMQFAANPDDAPLVRRQLQAHFPDAMFRSGEGALEEAWNDREGDDALVVEFGLAREFMLPLATGKLDPFVGIVGALSELQPGELGLFQVIFQPVSHPWPESIIWSVTHADGRPFFVNAPELTKAAEGKVRHPLFAAVVRIAVRASSFERVIALARDLAGSLRVFAHPQGNELIPLENLDYPFEEHIEDMLRRQSRRSGMLLSSEELIGFVHLPASSVRSPVFARETGKTKAAPAIVRNEGVLLGHNDHGGQTVPVRLTPDQRVQHTHIIGIQGTGKSTLLFNLIRQDIESGEGVAVLDPHGDLIDQILGIIPESRVGDVVLVDPSDEQYSVGFNILSAHSDLEKTLLSSDLVSVFERLSKSWGDQMASVLKNAILAFLESSEGGTLADLRRFLLEPAFREKFLTTVRDSDIVYYWRKGFVQLSGNKSIGPVITRLNDFLAPKPIRYMVSQRENRLDFGNILDTGKIFLAKLSQGQMGTGDSFLLGSLFVAKIQQLVMARQAKQAAARRNFWLYIDEFSNFITPSMAEILTGARKYRLGLILAHQDLPQLQADRRVAGAVMSMPYTRVVFRVGDADARSLQEGFSFFEAKDLQNLGKGQAICRVEKADNDFNLSVPLPDAIDLEKAAVIRQRVIAASRATYARPRAEVAAALDASLASETVVPAPAKAKPISPPASKVAEVPTVSGEEKPVAPKLDDKLGVPTVPSAEVKPQLAKDDKGIGGHQHNLIRERIEIAARHHGFSVEREKPTADGKKIDLALERSGELIACEISIMTTVDWEVGNAAKCLKAGCRHVAMICPDEAKLERIRKAVAGCISVEEQVRVGFYLPEQFIEYLQALKPVPPMPSRPGTAQYGKYAVRRRAAALSAEEIKAREAMAHRVMVERMRSKERL
jgi:Type IV secretion-system coupling protein DNA-binding domain